VCQLLQQIQRLNLQRQFCRQCNTHVACMTVASKEYNHKVDTQGQ